MSRIQKQFSPKDYSEDRMHLIWAVCSNYSCEDVASATRFFLGSSRRSPLVDEFRDYLKSKKIIKQPTQESAVKFINNDPVFYHLQGNVFANNNYIVFRDDTPRFIIKSEHADNELVIFDQINGKEKRSEAQRWIEKGIYADEMEKLGFHPNKKA
jgi:hypothetical protein